ncbi:hypothetical protein MYXO_01649 [Myxococcaceae bacterium]|jgi:hypothetical protein|nr:hypothetical protein MYXO_01649 [Myxococcaceae bacterium]
MGDVQTSEDPAETGSRVAAESGYAALMSRPTPDRARHGSSTSPERLVTVAAFSEPIEAHLARSRLECEGLACSIADEHIVGVYWLSASAVGGVKLQVRERDREHALRVLEEVSSRPVDSAEWVTGDLDAPRCPSCGSLRVARERIDRRWFWLSWLLLGIPIPFLERHERCRRCHARWRVNPPAKHTGGASSG